MMWAAMWDRASKQKRTSPWLCCSVHRPDPSLREEGLVVSQMGIAIIVTAFKGRRLWRTNTVGYDGELYHHVYLVWILGMQGIIRAPKVTVRAQVRVQLGWRKHQPKGEGRVFDHRPAEHNAD